MSKKPVTKINQKAEEEEFALGMYNYKLILIGAAIILVGFFLMAGSTDIYDFRKTVLAPIVIVAGFTFELYAIMKRPPRKADQDPTV